MTEQTDFRIDVEAAKALISWKSLFANEVALRARQVAVESGRPERVTLAHYRQAAQMALRTLSAAILGEGSANDDHKSD